MPRFKALDHSNLWIRVCQSVLYPLTRVVGKRDYRGMERFNRPGGMLVVGNHISHLDPMYDVVMIHKAGRVPHVLAKASLWKIPVVGRALRGTGQIPVERAAGAGQSAVETARQTLDDGGLVLIYPEGTVTKEPDFWPMRPRPGVAVLAMASDAAVVPIVHWGTQDVYNSYAEGSKLKLVPRQRVIVAVGPDIDVSAYRGRQSDPRAIMEVSMLIMNTIADLLAEIRGEQRPAQLFDPKKAERQARKGPTSGDSPGTSAGPEDGGR
ncbi:lysophospholipid acyltransferase family protein [Nakamurella lactea]|uniref:lysophospholipid acyltransferase family protein n=1 Tax=Nakamurella lactea TaxID=459515 RepID=UPI000408477B|nr:lysophospholipid acyltransferase family protein [Nakamurella lactea]